MREMKDSGLKWLGYIPKNWNIERLQWHMYEINVKNNPIRTTQVLSLTNKKGVVPYEEKGAQGNISKENYSEYHLAYKNTIVANSMNILIGSVAYSKYYGCVSPVYYVFKEKRNNNLNFINYIFQTSQFQKELRKYANGILEIRMRVSVDDILKRMVAFPSIQEQKLIVEYLDEKCAEIDGTTKDLQEQIDTLENYKKSVITEAVTKGLNPNVEMKSSPIAWAKNIPSHWKHMPNKYIMTKIKKICPFHNDEDIISLSMNGVVVRDLDAGGKMPATFNGYQFVYPGNLLMCLFDYDVTPRCIGYIKNYGITSPAYSQFKMDRNNFAKYYYYYYLMIDNTKELLHLAKNLRHSFTEDELGKIYAIVPPIQEQKEIANYLDNKCAEIDEIIKSKKEQVEIIEEYKKSLIYEYVTGKKEVKNA